MKFRLLVLAIFDLVITGIFLFGITSHSILIKLMIGDPLTIALAVVIGILVFGFVLVLNISILSKPRRKATSSVLEPRVTDEVNTLESISCEVHQYMKENTTLFMPQMKSLLAQIERLEKKLNTVLRLLGEKFDSTEMSYRTFKAIVDRMEHQFLKSSKSILAVIDTFDDEEYTTGAGAFMTAEQRSLRKSLHDKYKDFAAQALSNNEEIILKCDQLTLELAQISELSPEEVVKNLALTEIDSLIQNTKLYK